MFPYLCIASTAHDEPVAGPLRCEQPAVEGNSINLHSSVQIRMPIIPYAQSHMRSKVMFYLTAADQNDAAALACSGNASYYLPRNMQTSVSQLQYEYHVRDLLARAPMFEASKSAARESPTRSLRSQAAPMNISFAGLFPLSALRRGCLLFDETSLPLQAAEALLLEQRICVSAKASTL